MSLDLAAQEERIQSLADILSLVAIVGGMEKSAIQRVLITLGSSLLDGRSTLMVDRDLASRLLTQIAKESGERAAIDVANDINFVAQAWKPVLSDSLLKQPDPHRTPPFGEIIFSLVNYSGHHLQEYGAFDQLGGADMVLPMTQLSAALKGYAAPIEGLSWDFVGFTDPADQALVASDAQSHYLFKFAPTPTTLRISELERGSDDDARNDHTVRIDPPMFAAFIAGLLGDMLYWAARLRQHADPGRETWARLNALLYPARASDANTKPATSDKPA